MEEITIAATVENIETATAFVNRVLEAMDCPMKAMNQIDITIDELFGNIAMYAYPDGPGEATVRVETPGENTVVITLLDRGVPYDPLERKDPDITLPAEEREIGGLGVFLSKKLMDELQYEYQDGQNVLTIRKTF